MTTIELVRHAEAQSRESWGDRPDRDRPLTEAGRSRAAALAHSILAEGPVDACFASPTVRCAQTLEPLVAMAGGSITDEAALGEALTVPSTDRGNAWVASAWLGGRALSFVDRVVSELEGRRIVACSHGDVVPALLAVLAGRDGLLLPDVRLDKGARIALRFDAGRCVSATRPTEGARR